MSHRFSIALALLGGLMLAGITAGLAMPSPVDDARPTLGFEAIAGLTHLAQAQPAQVPAPAAAAAATPAQPSSDEPIGNVATLTGTATVIRDKNSLPLNLKDDIYLNDELQTSANSTLGITFNDATTFNLTANAKITVDSYIYEDGGKQNGALFDITKGTVAFVAAAVAKTGDMKIATPTATLGIRGTTGLVEVPEGAAAGTASNVKLYPDADGRVGRIEVSDRSSGARLGFLTQGASGFTIRGGPGMRATALPLRISSLQAQRDQGIVRQVHAAQSVGRQVVTEQRALRRANPALNNRNRANPPRQGGPQQPNAPQRQNNLQNRPGPQQPGVPGRQGLQQRPGAPAQPGSPARPGSPAQPGSPAPATTPQRGGELRQPGAQPPNRAAVAPSGAPQPGVRQNGPGVPQLGPQSRPGLPKLRPARPAPKGKKEKRH
jgi:FecR protein